MTYRTLNDMMDIDHVILVNPDGTVSDAPSGIYAPDLNMETDDDGQILDEHEKAYMADAERQGWRILSGFTYQYSYDGIVMHPSEYVGGGLEDYIRDNPGYYVVIDVQTDDDDDETTPGWAIAYREATN